MHNIADYHCLYCQFNAMKIDKMRQHIAERHPQKLMFASARFHHADYSPHRVGFMRSFFTWKCPINYDLNFYLQPSKIHPTIILNLADAVDETDVRVRKLQSASKTLDSMDISVEANLAEQFAALTQIHRNWDSNLPMSTKTQANLRDYTIRTSYNEFVTFDDFQQKYLNVAFDEVYRRWELKDKT